MSSRNSVEKDEKNQFVQGLTKLQKIVVVVLALFAILIVAFYLSRFRSQLEKPLGSEPSPKDKTQLVSNKQLDTDHDGLSDYDEINKYHTSPYLKDSDSDGISDYDEIKNGTDPNCPQGKTCYNGAVVEATSTPNQQATTTNTTNTIGNQLNTTNNLDSSKVDKSVLEQILKGQGNAKTLRQALIKSGADKDMLNSISDKDLMASYQKLLNNQNK